MWSFNTQATCKKIEYVQGGSYITPNVPGNPRRTMPSQLTLICIVNGTEVVVNIKKDLTRAILSLKRGLSTKFPITEERLNAIKSQMPSTVTLEENLDYDANDDYATRAKISAADINAWANKIVAKL